MIVETPPLVQSIYFEGEYSWHTPRGERRSIEIDFLDRELPYAALGARIKQDGVLDGKGLRAGQLEFRVTLYADRDGTQPLVEPMDHVITISPEQQ